MILGSLSSPGFVGQQGKGTGARSVPVPLFFWPALLLVLGIIASGVPLSGNVQFAFAVVVMLIGGLPHGAYDIELARKAMRLGKREVFLLTGTYVVIAGVMLALWIVAPLVALGLFLAMAAVHFGEDWRMIDSGLLRTMAGASIICTPAIARPDEVSALFVAMAGPGAEGLAHLAIACAPVALLVTLVGMLQALRAGNAQWVAAQSAALAALAFLPPPIAFALYFVFLHSPLHMRGLGFSLSGWSPTKIWAYGFAICGICVVGGLLLAPNMLSGEGVPMSADSFRLLSVVAAPHLLLTFLVERRSFI